MRVPALTSSSGHIGLLQFDQSRKLADFLSLDVSLLNNVEVLHRVNQLLVQYLTPEATGIIIDPIYTFDALAKKTATAAALIRLEQNKDFLPTVLPELLPNFSLEEVKNNYALAKLELSYHPQEEKALEKKQLLAEIQDYTRILGIDFFLDLKVFNPDLYQTKIEQAKKQAPVLEFSFQDAQLAAIQELRNYVDIIGLEYPGDPLSAATLSTQLDVPWLLTAAPAESYADFKERFREVMENGAHGYCLGPTLWQEIGQWHLADQSIDWPALEKYIQGTVRDRVMELNRIASESLSKNSL